jgi:predicted nuclease of predicted toxin-antitoxin system
MALRLAADENVNNDILRGLARRSPGIDLVRVQDVGLSGATDATVLEWAAHEGRVLVTHDAATVPAVAYDRAAGGQTMPGVVVIDTALSVASTIEDLVLLAEASEPDEWAGQILYLPLR